MILKYVKTMDYQQVLENLNTSAIKLMETHSLEALSATIVNEARKLVQAEHGSIFLEEEDKLERIYTSSPALHNVRPRKNGYTEKAFKQRTVATLEGKKLIAINPIVRKMNVNSLVMIPLYHRTQSIGVLTMYFEKQGHFNDKELHILKLYGSMASLAITRTRLHESTTQAVELRDRFISLASHELRTPLTSINGYIQLLHTKLADKGTIESRWIKELYNESLRMTNLVKDLLDVNRIRQGQLALVFSEVSMTDVLQKVIAKYHALYPERVFRFKKSATIKQDTVIGDNEKLQEMISAFVGNAIKFSKPTSKITITLAYTNRNLVIKIIDEGKGIPQQDLENIFAGFYKTKHSKEKEGMGIGLLLAKHIVQLHKGKINIISEENKGTTVQVDLPTAKI
jgi:K+-sensing histidine kinase KdpD